MPHSGSNGRVGKPAVPGAQLKQCSIVPYLAQELLVCGKCHRSPLWLFSEALPKFPSQAALPTSLVPLACALGLKQAPGSTQDRGLQTPALVLSLLQSARICPGEVNQRPRTFLSSQSHPQLSFYQFKLEKDQHSPA